MPRRRTRPGRALLLRAGIATGCLLATTAVLHVERIDYSNAAGPPPTWLDSLYSAVVTLSTTGSPEIDPTTPLARLTNILLIIPLRFVFLVVLVATTIELLTRRAQYSWQVRRWRDKVSDHTVVIGYGIKGRGAVRGLLDNGTPAERIVVVAADENSVRDAGEHGVTAVEGDACRESVLDQAGVSRAARVVIATGDDSTSVLITMLVRRLSPKAVIVTVARETSNAQFLRDSGADVVIVTAEAVGHLLSLSLVSPTAGALIEDLLDSSRGLEVLEREITPAEIGLGPEDLDTRGDLVLAVLRDGEVFRFDGRDVRAFNRGDRVVVIRQSRRDHSPN